MEPARDHAEAAVKSLRILGLVPYPIGHAPGQRFRIEQWAPRLADLGIDVIFSPFLSPRAMSVLYDPGHRLLKGLETLAAYRRRLRLGRTLDRFDAAFIYRESTMLGPPFHELAVARRLPVVFDFDDAIYLPAVSPANRWVAGLKSSRKADAICQAAAHVTVGNEHLAEYARQWARRVTILPTTIDTGVYTVRPRAANARPVLGWTGSPTTLPYLQAMHGILCDVQRRVPFDLLVIGVRPDLPGLNVQFLPWQAITEAEDLRATDVGLMPLSDDPWTRGKCGAKALQYMALGIPAVVSPVGANRTIVRDGENGFHARDAAEWVARLCALLIDPQLRVRLGRAAAHTVATEYSAAVHAPRLAAVLRDEVARVPTRQ